MSDHLPSPAPSPRRVSSRERWLWLGVVAAVAVGYAVLRVTMNEQFRPASWARLLEFRAPLPFGHRVLVPLLARPWVDAGFSTALVLGVFEAVAAGALAIGTAWTLRPTLGPRHSGAAAVALLLLLPWLFLLPHRWPIFYPWDTPAMALLVVGVGLVQRERWRWLMIVAAVAALNRESALLLPLVVLGCAARDERGWRPLVALAAGVLAVVLAVRLTVAVAWPDNPGDAVHLRVEGQYRLLHNLDWLRRPANFASTVVSLGLWPLLWPLLARYVEPGVRRLWTIAWLYTGALLVVANIYEPRAFGEPLALAFVPTVIGVVAWMRGEGPGAQAGPPVPQWLRVLDRYAWLCVVVAVAVLAWALRRWPDLL